MTVFEDAWRQGICFNHRPGPIYNERLREMKSMVCLWWGKMILIGFFSLFFLVFGIETLIGAFHLQNPLEFIMYFFSASFMILVSLVGILYPAFQVHAHLKTGMGVNHDEK
jgi:hypothetical protein